MNVITAGLHAWVSQKNPDVRAPTPLRRALQYIHSVIKELVTIKMPNGIKATGQVSAMPRNTSSTDRFWSSLFCYTNLFPSFILHLCRK
jgi:hypothetical protein